MGIRDFINSAKTAGANAVDRYSMAGKAGGIENIARSFDRANPNGMSAIGGAGAGGAVGAFSDDTSVLGGVAAGGAAGYMISKGPKSLSNLNGKMMNKNKNYRSAVGDLKTSSDSLKTSMDNLRTSVGNLKTSIFS